MRFRHEFLARDLRVFVRTQKNIFFSKADFSVHGASLSHQRILSADKREIKKVFQEFFATIPSAIVGFSLTSLHRVYRVALQNKSYVIRIWDKKKGIPPIHFFTESRIITRLMRRGDIPVVPSCAIDTSRSVAPFDFQILEMAPGMLLYNVIEERKNFVTIHRDLGRVVARIHSTHLQGYGHLVPDSILGRKVRGCMRSWRAFLLTQLDQHITYCHTKKLVTQETAKEIRRILRKGIHKLSMYSPRLLHGDLAQHNLFSDGRRITAIIDWEDALAGDPIYDIAYWGTGSFGHDAWLTAFLKGYTSVCLLPKDFIIRYWIYYLRIVLAKTVARDRFGLDDFTSQGYRFSDRILYGFTQLDSILSP